MTEQAIQIANPAATKPGYKHTPLGWIPEEWEVIPLGNIFSFKNGLNKEKEFFGKGTPIVNYTDVYNNNYIESEKLTGKVELSPSEIKRYEVKKGDVFFTRTSETIDEIGLSTVIVDEPKNTVFSGFILRARPQKGILNINYTRYCFSTFYARKEIIRKSTYTTRALTNGGFLSEVLLFVPSMPEQKAIAALLSTWDKAIATTTRLIEQKQQRKKWLMQQLLTGKKRLKGFSGEWKEVRLGDVFKERNETKIKGLPLLSVGSSGIYPQTDSAKKDTSNKDKSKYKKISVGDIGYNTMRLWQGRCALSQLEGIISPAYTVVTPKLGNLALYYAYLFQLPATIHSFYRHSQGLVNDTLNCKFKDFSKVKVSIPKLEEQTAIATVLQSADKEIQLLQTQLQQLKEQKRGLMQVLLTGKIRLKGKNNETKLLSDKN